MNWLKAFALGSAVGRPVGFRISVGAAAAILVWGAGSLSAAMTGPVRTEAGLVSGTPGRNAGVTAFKGVPYAAPPLGDLRWRPPQPPIAWQGVRKADQFGSPCTQRAGAAWKGAEDCLFLNVWTGASSDKERRPVMVWSYENGFAGNDSANPLWDGEGLARKGVIVVTMNYRADVFGFLALPELSKESGHNASGNYGMLDQIAVLQWVKKNITAFGGDPNRVTIAGQSAGGLSTLIIVKSPLAQGLFHRAIMESHARGVRRSLPDAEKTGQAFADGLGAHSLKELRDMPAQQITAGLSGGRGGGGQGGGSGPIIDNYVVLPDFYNAYSNGIHNVPIIVGQNKDESGASPHPNVKLDLFRQFVNQKYGAVADQFLKLYPAGTDEEAGQAQNDAAHDDDNVASFLTAAEGNYKGRNKAFAYFWTHAWPGPEGERRGAFHESEIPFAFNSLDANNQPWTAEDHRIADTMSSYWANFIATGDPNGKGLAVWSPANIKSPVIMELGNHFGPIPVAEKARLDLHMSYFLSHGDNSGWLGAPTSGGGRGGRGGRGAAE
jgi:para-nitrobenzyl esterase